MLVDELLDGFLKDEVSPEKFDEEFAKLTDEDKTKVNERLSTPEAKKALADANTKALESLKGVRTAAKKIQGDTPPDLAASLRKENVTKASGRFFAELGIPAEQQTSYLEDLEKSDNTTVSEDLLYDALGRIYASKNSNTLLKDKKELDKMKENGEQFNADNAGSAGGSGGDNGDGTKRDPKVLEWMREANSKGIPFDSYEAAEKALNGGTARVIS